MQHFRRRSSTAGGKHLVSGLFWLNQMNESEDQFRAMIDTMPGWAWSSRADGSTEFLNHSWLDYTGLPMEEGLGWAWKDRIYPDDLEQLLHTWQRLMGSGQPGEEQARLRRSDGEYRWFLFRAVPVRDERGEIIRWYGTNTDIEDLKRTEALLSAEKRTLTDVLEELTTSEAKLRRDEAELRGDRRSHTANHYRYRSSRRATLCKSSGAGLSRSESSGLYPLQDLVDDFRTRKILKRIELSDGRRSSMASHSNWSSEFLGKTAVIVGSSSAITDCATSMGRSRGGM